MQNQLMLRFLRARKPSCLSVRGSFAVFFFPLKKNPSLDKLYYVPGLACEKKLRALSSVNAGLSLATPLRRTKRYNFPKAMEGSWVEIFTTTSNCSPPKQRVMGVEVPTSVLICISCTSSLVC